MQNEFEPGDLVEVISPDYERQESIIDDIGFNGDMENDIGKRFRVEAAETSHDHECYKLEGSRWVWACEWLMLVESNNVQGSVTEEDFDSVYK